MGRMTIENRKAIDYGDGIIWYFDNYPKEYYIDQYGRWIELPSQTLWIKEGER